MSMHYSETEMSSVKRCRDAKESRGESSGYNLLICLVGLYPVGRNEGEDVRYAAVDGQAFEDGCMQPNRVRSPA